jgi:acyl carrier protein
MTLTLERTVIELVARQGRLDPAAVTPATSFEEIGMGSLGAIELLFALEERFNITIPDDRAQTMRTVGEVIEGLRSLGIGDGHA